MALQKFKRCVSKLKKKCIIARDKNICLACGIDHNLTIDHIVPLVKGGSNRHKNLQTLCEWCNLLKGQKIISYNWRYGSRLYVKHMRIANHTRF